MVAAGATFVLAVLSLKLGVTPFALWVKLILFGGACLLSVACLGVLLWAMRGPPRKGIAGSAPPKGSRPTKTRPEDSGQAGGSAEADVAGAGAGRGAQPPPGPTDLPPRGDGRRAVAVFLLCAAMLFTAASAVGKVASRKPTQPGATAVKVEIAPHVDLRGAKLVLGASGTRTGRAISLAGKAFGSLFASGFKQALARVGGAAGRLLDAFAKGGLTFSPTFNFGGGGNAGNGPSLTGLISAIEKAHFNFALNGPAPPADCAHYFLTLDALADDETAIASAWPLREPDRAARTCGLGDQNAMRRFLSYLGKR
jgi:hypothetical protein